MQSPFRPASPRRVLPVIAIGLASLAAACAGGSSDDASPATTTTETTSRSTTSTTEAATTTTTTTIDLMKRPPAATSPEEVSAQIVEAETAIRDPEVTGDALAAAGHLQQAAYRTLANNPEWDEAVAQALPEELRDVAAANVGASRELMRFAPRDMLPAWRIVSPPAMDELRGLYQAAEAEFGVPWQYLAAVNLVETRMGRIRGTSHAGAQGPMQFLPSTWEAYGEGDINSYQDAIRGAARYMAANGGDCRPGARCDLRNAVWRYNPTDKYLNSVIPYAEQMRADERAYRGYYHWQVYYKTPLGDVWLREGYEATEQRPVTPEDLE
jgi:hypothetical protein